MTQLAGAQRSPTRDRSAILDQRRGRWLLVVVILAGLALRLFELDGQSLWFDEAARLAMALSDLSSFWQNAAQDTLPPFYHFTEHFWLLLGVNDYLARFPSVVLGVLLLSLTYRLGQDLFGHKTALVATALVAIMPYHIYHSQQANLYALLAFLSGLQIWLFWKAAHQDGWQHWLAFGVCAVVGLYTHYFTAFILATLHLYWLIYRPRGFRQWTRLMLVDGLIVVAFLPLIGRLMGGVGVVFTNFWLTKPGPVAPLATLYLFVVSYSLPFGMVPLAMFIMLDTLVIGMYELVYGLRHRQHAAEPLVFVLLLVFVPLVAVFAISQLKPIFLQRALIVVLPAFVVLLGRALSTSRLRSPLPYLYLLLAGAMALSLFHYYFDPEFAKPPLRDAATYISSQFRAGDVIVHTTTSSFLPFLFYAPPQDQYVLPDDPDPYQPQQVFRLMGGRDINLDAIEGYQRVWLVADLDHSVEYQKQVMAHFDESYSLLSDASNGKVIVRAYDLSQDSRSGDDSEK
jgi:mannosyltransferase